jgi:hypothetical protein
MDEPRHGRLHSIVEGVTCGDAGRTFLSRDRLKERVTELTSTGMKIRTSEILRPSYMDVVTLLSRLASDLSCDLFGLGGEPVVHMANDEIESSAHASQYMQEACGIWTTRNTDDDGFATLEHPVARCSLRCLLCESPTRTADH